MSVGRNYVKFDFNNIKLAHTWLPSIQNLKDILLEYIQENDFHIFNKVWKPDTLNFYSVSSKLTSLNEIYILLIFVTGVGSEGIKTETFHETYINTLNDLYKILKIRTNFDNISLYYQLTNSKMKPNDSIPVNHVNGPLDICEDIMGYRIYISPNSFTQSNYDAMIQLYSMIDSITKESKIDILHYYGRGMTPISHVLRNNFKKIYGYSSCKISYDDGLKSIATNNVDNIELIYDKNKEKFFENIDNDKNQMIIISASRNGFRKLEYVKKFTRFIYIACNMKSFLEEIKDLSINYKILGEIDMFPGTEYKELIIDMLIK